MDITTHILVESRLHGDQYTIRFNTQKMRTFLEKNGNKVTGLHTP